MPVLRTWSVAYLPLENAGDESNLNNAIVIYLVSRLSKLLYQFLCRE
jgi:hypothetical protein